MKNKHVTNIDEFLKIYGSEKLRIFDESFHVRNLYDGLNVLTNYTGFELMQKSVKSRITEVERDIAALYLGFNLATEQIEFLSSHSDELKKALKEYKLNSFDLNSSGTFIIDLNMICDGRSEDILKKVRPSCWENIYSLLIELNDLKTMYRKMKSSIDEEFIEDLDEIEEAILQDYSELDVDNLENCEKEFNLSNGEILAEAISYAEKHQLKYFEVERSLKKYFNALVMIVFSLVGDVKKQMKNNE